MIRRSLKVWHHLWVLAAPAAARSSNWNAGLSTRDEPDALVYLLDVVILSELLELEWSGSGDEDFEDMDTDDADADAEEIDADFEVSCRHR